MLAGGLMLSACSRGNNTPSNTNQRTATIAKGSISASVNATGNIAPEGEVKLNFQTQGTVSEIKVKQGDKVKKGVVLALLDLTDLQIALAQAQTALVQAQAAAASAEAAGEQADIAMLNAQAQQIIAQANYSRTVDGGVRPGDITAAQAAINAAQASYARATDRGLKDADIRAAKATLEAAKANYAKVTAGPQREDYAAADAALKNAEAALRQAQASYDRAYKTNPAAIGASPAGLQLEQATNNYNSAKAQLDKASKAADNAQVQAAYQQVQSAQSNLDRLMNNSNENANAAAAMQQMRSAQAQLEKLRQPVRPYEIEQAKAQREQVVSQLKQADVQKKQSEIQKQQADVQRQQAELQVRQAQRRIEQAALTAPTDGTVSVVNAKVGESAAGTAAAVILLDDAVLHIDVTVDEIDIARIKVGQEVQLTLDALSGTAFVGKVDRIAPNSTLVNGVVSYPVRVVLTGNTAALKPGMTASSSILLEKRDNVLLAPNWAVRRDRKTNKSFITVKDGDKSNEIEITTGLRNDQFTEVLSGLNEGQVVVAPVTPSAFGQ